MYQKNRIDFFFFFFPINEDERTGEKKGGKWKRKMVTVAYKKEMPRGNSQ